MTDKDQVRLLIGDTDTGDAVFSDTEVNQFISTRTVLDTDGGTTSVNVFAAAADACSAAAAKFSRGFNFSEDGQQFMRAQRVGHYLSLERSLRARAGGVSVPVGTSGTATV